MVYITWKPNLWFLQYLYYTIFSSVLQRSDLYLTFKYKINCSNSLDQK